MSNLLMINKHGSNIPVYDINNDSRQIGYLNNREAFVQYSTNGSNRLYIYFLDGSGNFTKGVIKEDADYNLSFYTEYPIKKEYIERNQYMLFKMRKSMPVYYSDGRRCQSPPSLSRSRQRSWTLRDKTRNQGCLCPSASGNRHTHHIWGQAAR